MMQQNRRALSMLAFTAVLMGCQVQPESGAGNQPYQYQTDIRWTSYGIPHVAAEDWGSLGYGFAYATATDAVCVLARDVAVVNGELSRFFGVGDGNLESDIFHKAILPDARLAAFAEAQSTRANAFSAGYVAGYNRYLRDHAERLPASCAGASWVREITDNDVIRLAMGVGIRYGLGRFRAEIANASPATTGQEQASTQWELPIGIGSNAVAVGSALTASKRGILLGNPHYPWHGASRFHLIHTTIPGEVDVMGTSLLNTSRVAIGFNKDIAWTHTVSTALRFTLYQLELVGEDRLSYRYDGQVRRLRKQTVVVTDDAGLETERNVYFSHFGPIIENEAFPWTQTQAYALRDAVIDNFATADTYDAMNKAGSVAELEQALELQGVYWTNTVAADRDGNAFYADISATPNVDKTLLNRCQVKHANARLVVLKGNTADCEWYQDPASRVAGALPPGKMPRLTVDSYVTNSNDSYWLSNPEQPIEGYSPIIGAERTVRSLRTRAGLNQMGELLARGTPLTPDDIQAMLYNHRNYGAELLLDDVLAVCPDESRIAAVCSVLGAWDRTGNLDSVGSHVWREFWEQAQHIDNLYAVAFDVADPSNTPRGINLADQNVRAAVVESLAQARVRLSEANVALNAPLGAIQYAQRNGERIGIPGGEGWAGMFSMIRTKLSKDQGYSPIVHGNSYIQVVSWDQQGNIDPRGMLTYSQSPEPESDHYQDLTKLYSQGQWIQLPFTEAQIAADPNLRTLRLTE
ncbi:MAG: penicillin acylase family protein [Pseudomonadales bacterium]